ncbi:unnamed protein product [Chrysoparadoxa australica]
MRQRPRTVVMLAGAGLALFTGLASAEIYRWVDDQGRVHYGDRPAAGRPAEKLQSTPAGPARTADRDTSGNEAGRTDEADDRAERAAEVRQQECEKARTRLQAYRDAARLTTTGPEGETRELDADERVDVIVRAEEQVAELCPESD